MMAGDLVVVGVFMAILFTIFYILKRFNVFNIPEEVSATTMLNPKPPVFDSVNVHNPFSVTIQNSESTTIEDYVHLQIVARRKCILTSFWNVNIDEALQKRNLFSKHEPLSKCLMDHSSSFTDPVLLNATDGETHPYVCKSDMIRKTANKADVKKYCALVVNIELPREECERAVMNEDIVCLLTIINANTNASGLRNDWKIEYQIIQTASDQLFTLKNLYASGVPDLESADSSSAHELCTICLSFPVTRALLPCRHKCICGVCFQRTKLCPICRKTVTSYLVTKDESHLPQPMPDEEEVQQHTREALNDMGIIELLRAIWNAS